MKTIKKDLKMKKEEKERLKELNEGVYNLNANLSALIYIQKLKSLNEAERFMQKINQEIQKHYGKWIKQLREVYEKKNILKLIDELGDEEGYACSECRRILKELKARIEG